MKRFILSILVIILFAAVICFLYIFQAAEEPVFTPSATVPASSAGITAEAVGEDSLLPEDLDTIIDPSQSVPLDTIPSSYTVIVNRNYPLPSGYAPTDLTEPAIPFSFAYRDDKRLLRKVAAESLEQMFRAARKKRVVLCGISGYRSYQRQKEIYTRNVAQRGQAATDTVSAMPGSSEHQTGLTMDISAASVGYRLDQSFGDTREGRWVAKNGHKYGYIVRYPYGKSEITGYHYEPWHIRYVGVDVATYLYKNDLTLEEYYGVSCHKAEEDTGVDVEEPDEVKYATPKPTKKPKVTAKPKASPSSSPRPTPKKTKKPKVTKKPKKTKKPAKTAKPKPTRKPTRKPKATAKPTQAPETETIQPTEPDNTEPPEPAPTETV